MALNTNKNLKLYYSIKEVAQMFDVSESLLRYWETEFPQIKPKTRVIYNLVKVRGFKLAAARKMLSQNKHGVDKSSEVLTSLLGVRDDLKALKKQLDALV